MPNGRKRRRNAESTARGHPGHDSEEGIMVEDGLQETVTTVVEDSRSLKKPKTPVVAILEDGLNDIEGDG